MTFISDPEIPLSGKSVLWSPLVFLKMNKDKPLYPLSLESVLASRTTKSLLAPCVIHVFSPLIIYLFSPFIIFFETVVEILDKSDPEFGSERLQLVKYYR